MYQNELNALKKANRFRERKLFDSELIDFASNDYLGFANDKKQFKKAYQLVREYDTIAPKASMLVNGYHEIHEAFEKTLSKLNGFEKGLVVGSGFLANIALIESLVRKRDMLFIDEDYHASGMMATGLLGDRVVKVRHNDPSDLEEKLKQHTTGRKIIAVEGVYSMSGKLCKREIFELADRYEALLIVDEAHSSGVLGENLLGIFEYYDIEPQSNHIKMGTLGKAYGSYGAYILASSEIISFLENRGKPIIYATAPSVFDTALALINIIKVSNSSQKYYKAIKERQAIIKEASGVELKSLIFALPVPENAQTIRLQEALMTKGFLVGAIRQPTVTEPILRIIPRLGSSKKSLKSLLNHF
ncbi:pyridoxal phosphate-dependent aminotransferase family protein [Sulfurovum sp. bin170]|uniref:aminotransferase class I/II-fold pyridoxal phosphate-dependent enzyme n=1 Tax=Sulfurovum sp. bin170 TaxID=2695268 RepID=UPI0013E09794|nr:pyridoxal phosphate-dependent aminotransferase family protein [Sulfurovum sp. bin170]NEW59844.1 pyridoxal phosphate-dependent aminotransferase family protein [Sulfurovum sp. bin170]